MKAICKHCKKELFIRERLYGDAGWCHLDNSWACYGGSSLNRAYPIFVPNIDTDKNPLLLLFDEEDITEFL